jgi:protoporphyrinogen oxidase
VDAAPERTPGHAPERAGCVVVGGGPAGLTAAYELSKLGRRSLVLEADRIVGGISRTAQHEGYRFDVGGHRFFTKVPYVQQLWEEILGEEFLTRPRLSRIHYRGKLFDYPLKPLNALGGLGPFEAARVGLSYARARLFPHRDERTFEQWVTNRFGRRLFEIFFKTYTEKVWGMSCSEISAEWAAQRIKDLDLVAAVRAALFGSGRSKGEVITTLIDEFHYPRRGPGQMWEACTERLRAAGSEVRLGARVVGLEHEGGRVRSLRVRGDEGESRIEVEDVISSLPLRTLARMLDPAPPEAVLRAAERLRYRDFLTVVLVLEAEELFPDNWIYVHSPDVQVGRIQNYKNWSPDMVPDAAHTTLGLEYFVQAGDELWNAEDDSLLELAEREIGVLGLARGARVVGGTVLRMPKAYPVYDDAYTSSLEVLRAWLGELVNLQQVGRNGQHRYNNQDHSMMTGVLAARNLCGESNDIWSVNVEQEYHEEGRGAERAVPTRVEPAGAADAPGGGALGDGLRRAERA